MRWQPALRGDGRPSWLRKASAVLKPALGALAASLLALGPAVTTTSAAFDLDDVAIKAAQLAEAPFRDAKGQVPDWLLEITYDQWRDIRFRPERALWQDARLPFRIQFFHPGLYYDRPVAMNVVDTEGVHPLEFSPSLFDYGKTDLGSRVPQDLGYAGFRIHYPIKTPKYHDEVIVFLGASYFRGVGKQQGFGASVRGLAIDTALSSGEEFPYFKEFWLLRPARGAAEMTVLALLDSPSLTGAYRFVIRPGEQTTVATDARIFRRREVKKLGIAPITSMFFYGENTLRSFDNFRPEVHDSDGLLVASETGEWIWRPLDNPEALQLSGFQMRNPMGFGLVQRDRDFVNYQDLETRPDLRPSVWVAPRGQWGAGRVELVEIPTHAETNDNIVAFWVPERLPPRGEPAAFSYVMYWYGDDRARPPGGRVTATRRDHGDGKDAHRFILDFTGKHLQALPPESVLRAVVTVGNGREGEGVLQEQHVEHNPVSRGWRLVFQVQPRTDEPLEIRAFLQHKRDALTETWSYVIEP